MIFFHLLTLIGAYWLLYYTTPNYQWVHTTQWHNIMRVGGMGEALLPSVMQGSSLLLPYGSAKWWGKIARDEVEVFMAMPVGFTSFPFIHHWSEFTTMAIWGENEKLKSSCIPGAKGDQRYWGALMTPTHLVSIQRVAEWASLRENIAGTQNGIMRNKKPLRDFQVQLAFYMNLSEVT